MRDVWLREATTSGGERTTEVFPAGREEKAQAVARGWHAGGGYAEPSGEPFSGGGTRAQFFRARDTLAG